MLFRSSFSVDLVDVRQDVLQLACRACRAEGGLGGGDDSFSVDLVDVRQDVLQLACRACRAEGGGSLDGGEEEDGLFGEHFASGSLRDFVCW